MILSQALNNAALKNPGAAAIHDLGKTLSYSDMRKKVSQLSYLHQAEIGHGKRIAFLSQNSQPAALSFFAFSNIGCPSIFLDPEESNEAIIQTLKDLEIGTVAVSPDQLSRLNDLIRSSGLAITPVEIEKKKGGEYDTSFSPPPDHPLKETDPVLILRHEEFGAAQKYIFFTHKQVYSAASFVRKFYHFGANDKVMTSMSWGHPFSLVHSFLCPILAGATCAINPQSPTNEEFLEYLAKNQINRFVDQPKYYYWLLSICMAAKYKLPGVRSVTVGAGNMPLAIRKAFQLLQIPVLQTYGRPEAIWTLAMQDMEKAKESLDSPLLPLAGFKYKVLNDGGDEIPPPGRREGPFALTGDSLMTSFFHPDKSLAEKASKQTIRGTWFYTGEAARLEGEEDELRIQPLGNLDDLIKTSSKYVGPERIDDVAKTIPDVTDAAGFVRLDERGEPSFAVAVVKQGKNLNEQQMMEFLQSRLSGIECPTHLFVVDRIPKDRYENVNRRALQRQYSAR